MLIRWSYNPKLDKVGTVEDIDDERADMFIEDGWAVPSDLPESPPEPPREEPHDEGESA